MKKILICGMDNAGKTTLANALHSKIAYSAVIDGDDVRKMYGNDLGFSLEDRVIQAQRMAKLAESMSEWAGYVIASFICPTEAARRAFQPDFTIYVTNPEKRPPTYPDTKEMFQAPQFPDYIVASDDLDANCQEIIRRCIHFNSQTSTAMFVGRFQPFHDGHKQLIIEGMNKTRVDQALICVRDMKPNDNNPFSYDHIKSEIYSKMRGYKVQVIQVPDIKAICYGRDVGYDVVQIALDREIEKISGTEIRKELAKKGTKIDVTA